MNAAGHWATESTFEYLPCLASVFTQAQTIAKQFPRSYVREMLDILQLARNYFQKIVKHLSFNRRHLTFKQA